MRYEMIKMKKLEKGGKANLPISLGLDVEKESV